MPYSIRVMVYAERGRTEMVLARLSETGSPGIACARLPRTSTRTLYRSRHDTSKMWSPFSLLSLAALLIPSQALYFYIDGPTQKCFFEELPKDTLVVGKHIDRATTTSGSPTTRLTTRAGTFSATQWNDQSRAYGTNPDMGIFITVDEVVPPRPPPHSHPPPSPL